MAQGDDADMLRKLNAAVAEFGLACARMRDEAELARLEFVELAAANEGLGPLPPQREGQYLTMLVVGRQEDPAECGHWSSPQHVQWRIDKAVAAERERWRELVQQLVACHDEPTCAALDWAREMLAEPNVRANLTKVAASSQPLVRVPLGWRFERDHNNRIVVTMPDGGGCVVDNIANDQRMVPEEVLFALCKALGA